MSTTALLDSVATPDPPGDRTLARLIGHVRALLPVGAVAIVTVDEARNTVERCAGWFADPKLGEALGPPGSHALDERRRVMVRTILERDRALHLPRLDKWEAAPALLSAAVESLGPERARRMWRACSRASVIVCPLRGEIGRPLGALVVASLDETRPLGRAELPTVEALADLASMALERTALLEIGGPPRPRRAAAEACHPGRIRLAGPESRSTREWWSTPPQSPAARSALLTRLNARAGELRTAARVNLSAARARSSLDSATSARSRAHGSRCRAAMPRRRRWAP